MKPSKSFVKSLSNIKLPDSYTEHILKFVSNEDLENIAKAMRSQSN